MEQVHKKSLQQEEEQLASTVLIAQSAKELDGLAIKLNDQINRFKIK
ncbi:hypothetical protein M3676_17920 [Metabacillus litoralis]|nr:hypothetical protein [Metabacillus litoralis]